MKAAVDLSMLISNFALLVDNLTPGEMECFADMIILHFDDKDKNYIVKELEGGAFGLHNNIDFLPDSSEMKSFLQNNPWRSDEIWECLKKHKKLGNLKKITKFFKVKTLTGKYSKMLRNYFAAYPISHELQRRIRKYN
jgi:hypothetical protein